MNSNSTTEHDLTNQTSSTLPQADGPSFLGPNNAISSEVPSRSQSPAKRLKSEEPPSTTLESTLDGPDPMIEDTSQPSRIRGQSVDMLDAVDNPITGDAMLTEDPLVATSAVGRVTPSTTNTAMNLTDATTIPPLQDQVQLVMNAKAQSLKEGEEWYIISGIWLKRFLAQDDHYKHEVSKEDLEKPIGPINNSSIVDTILLEEMEHKSEKSDEATDEEAKFIPIKQGTFGEDFEAFPGDVWNQLVSWYGITKDSPIIKRKVVNTNDNGPENLQIELYPAANFTIYRIRDPGAQISQDTPISEKKQKPQKVMVDKSTGVQKFLHKVKTLTGVGIDRKIRLWRLGQPADATTESCSTKSAKQGVLDRMVLDLKTFHEASPEALDMINDENHNQMKVGTAGLGNGGTIVVEEQTSDGIWFSEATTKMSKRFNEQFTVLKKGLQSANTSKKKLPLSSSRSSSPSKSIIKNTANFVTRGRERREGRQMGTCGLGNLGNTCYMNSALQCLRGVEELSKYFLSDEYIKEINPSNPLAHNGNVARAYAKLLTGLFAPNSGSSLFPREFKSVIGRYAASFSGYQQQDTQEFLAFLLDGLHEDLNRIVEKPYIEKPDSEDHMVGDQKKISELADRHWDIYKKRNDSAVADLFAGLYQSTLVCPTCAKVSITFDPFMDLTLPLPIESFWTHNIIFYPKGNDKYQKPVNVPVELPKHSTIGSLLEHLGKKLGIDPNKLIGSEVYKHKFYKHFDNTSDMVNQITANDDVVFYELEECPTNWRGSKKSPRSMLNISSYNDDFEELAEDAPETEQLLVPVFLKRSRSPRRQYGSDDWFGLPFFVLLNREEQNDYDTILGKIVERTQILTTCDLYEDVPINDGDADDEDESSVENIKAPIAKEHRDVEKDGFVDVTMKDTDSVTDSDESEKIPKRITRRKVPAQLIEQFELKVLERKRGERVPTAWQSAEIKCTLASRLRPESIRSPTPPNNRLPAQFTEFGLQGNSGRRTPASNHSEECDDQFIDAPEGNEPPMQDSSGDENETAYSHAEITSFNNSVGPGSFYNNSGNSSRVGLKSPARSDSPLVEAGPLPLIRFGEGIVMDFTEGGYDSIFGGNHPDDFRGQPYFDSKRFHVLDDKEMESARKRREERRRKGITLEDCLDEFAKEEVLSEDDPWFCPRCKKHRRASKKFELWKCPDILVVHLKRFSSSRSFRDKIDVHIQCPVEGLDLKNRVGNSKGKEHIYDLFAVDNHYGGLGGGHYTAHVKNWCDQKWYYCDDGSVRAVGSNNVVTSAAYLLFYRRRSAKPLGGPEFDRICTSVDKKLEEHGTEDDEENSSAAEPEAISREPSPENSGLMGPILQTMRFARPVGNSTLWGESKPASVDNNDDPPAYSRMPDEGIDNDNDKEMIFVSQSPVDNASEETATDIVLSNNDAKE